MSAPASPPSQTPASGGRPAAIATSPALGLPFRNSAPSREVIAELFRVQRGTDPIGMRIHEALAIACVFLAGWPTTYVELSYGPLLFCAAVRLTGHVRVPGPLLWDRVVQLLLGWIAFLFISKGWSPGSWHDWLIDFWMLRFALVIPALYMVMDRRPVLILALVLGIACGELSQLAHAAGIGFHISSLDWHRMPGRVSGWWDPVVGGSILCAGLGLHLSGFALGASVRERVIGAAGIGVTLACILATGTRGAWIGATLLMAIALGIAASRLKPRTRLIRLALVAAVLLAVAGGAAWFSAGPQIRQRIEQGRVEVSRAMTVGDYDTDTGMRIGMWRWAWMEFSQHPIIGVGAGGYKAWADRRLELERLPARAAQSATLPPEPRTHAHSLYVHALAITGLFGLGLLLGMILRAIAGGLRDPDSHRRLTGYAAGPALALIGLLCAGLFDTIQVNQQTANLIYILVAMCLPSRPPVSSEPWRAAR